MQLNYNKVEEALSHRGVELKVSQEVECSHSQQQLEEEHSLSEELLNQQEEVLYKGLKEEALSHSLLGVEVSSNLHEVARKLQEEVFSHHEVVLNYKGVVFSPKEEVINNVVVLSNHEVVHSLLEVSPHREVGPHLEGLLEEQDEVVVFLLKEV